jgi:hypothetical protein
MWSCDSLDDQSSSDDVTDKLHFLQLDLPWNALIDPVTIYLCLTSSDQAPCIISLIDMQATVFLHGAPLSSVGDISLPALRVLHEGY